MAFNYEYPQRLNLDTYDVFREQPQNDTSYIFIDKLPNILTYGKHFGTLSWRAPVNSQYQVKNGSTILFELKDQRGNIIKTDLSNTLPVNGSAVFYIWVEKNPLILVGDKYELTDGPCTLTVVYELDGVPPKWQGKYNGRSTFQFELQKNLPNTSPILFYSSSLISSSLLISESVELDNTDPNYKRSILHISTSNLQTEGGKIDFVEVAYNEDRENPSEFKLLTTYGISASGEFFEKTASEAIGLNPVSHIHKIAIPKDIRRNGDVTFKLRFLNPNKEVARNLSNNSEVVVTSTLPITGSPLLLETSDNLVHDSGGLFFGNTLADGIKVKFDKGSKNEDSRLIFQQFKGGVFDKEISRIDGTKQEYVYADVTTNKIDTSSGSAIMGGFNNKITGSEFAAIVNSTGSNIISGSLSTIVGGKGNTIQALNDTSSLFFHPNTIIGANNSEITQSGTKINSFTSLISNAVVGGSDNKIHIGSSNTIVGGLGCEIVSSSGTSVYNAIVGSQVAKIKGGSDLSVIIGSILSEIGDDTTSVTSGVLIGTSNGAKVLHDNSVIIGTNVTTTQANTVYVQNLSASSDLYVGGTLTANELHTTFTSASIIYESGSTKFGDSMDDIHNITGSVYTTGSVTINTELSSSAQLTVAGDISSSGEVRSTDVSANYGMFGTGDSAGNPIARNSDFGLQVTKHGGNAQVLVERVGNAELLINTTHESADIGSRNNYPLHILHNNTDRVKIDAVGINVIGHITASGHLYTPKIRPSGSDNTLEISASNVYITGSVGIGNPTPTTTLNVSGSVSASQDLYVRAMYPTNNLWISQSRMVQFGNDDSNGISVGQYADGELLFHVADDTDDEYMKISASKMLIVTGDISASGTLDITGNVNFDGDLDVDGTTNLDTVDIDGDVSLAGDLDFETSAGRDITFGDNLGAALEFKEAGNLYMRFVTTNGSEGVTLNKGLTATSATFSNNITANGNIVGDGSTDIYGINNISASGHITASGDISSSGNILASGFKKDGSDVFVDISSNTNLAGGTGITLTGDTLSTTDGEIVHDSLSGFVANEHIDHTGVTMTAGAGLNGGGTIAATRTFSVDSASMGGFYSGSMNDFTTTGNISGSSTSTGSFGHLMVGGGNFSSASLAAGGGGGVTSAVAGSGIDVSGATGAVTISIGTGEVVNAMIGDDEIDSEHYAAASIDDEHLSDGVATGLAGTGMTATSGVLNVIGGDGITANANDMAITAAQTTIESIYKADLVIGEDAQTKIDFETADEIHFDVNNVELLNMTGNLVSGSLISTGSFGQINILGDTTMADPAASLYVTGSVGIGNLTPTTALNVSGSISASGDLFVDDITADVISMGRDLIHTGDTDTKISFTTEKIESTADNISFVGNVTASADISASGTFIGKINSSDTNVDASHYPMLQTAINTIPFISNGMIFNPSNDELTIGGQEIYLSGTGGHITASGNISSSGTVKAATLDADAVTDGLAAVIVAEIDNDEIPIAKLAEDAVTVTAGDGLKTGGSVTLGSSVTLDIDVSDFAGTGLSGDGSENLNVDAAQTGINSILATDLVLGEDAQTKIDFETVNEIHFDVNNSELLNLTGNLISGSGVSTGSFGHLMVGGGNFSSASLAAGGGSGGSMDNFTLTADGGSNQTIADGNTLDIAGGDGITTAVGATDTVTINVDASQDGHISSILTTDLKLGEDAQTKIDFETVNEIHFDVNNSELLNLTGTKISGSLISTGSFGHIVGTTLELPNDSIPIAQLASDAITIAGTSTALGGSITADTIAGQISADTISGNQINGGTIGSVTITQLGGALDVNNENITNIDVDSGTIDGTTIGGASAAAGTFTTLNATSLNVTHFTSSVVTSSTILTEGNTQFGDASTDTHTFNGHITASNNISASGNLLVMSGSIGTNTIANNSVFTVEGNISASGTIYANGGDFNDADITNVATINVDAVSCDAGGDVLINLTSTQIDNRIDDTGILRLGATSAEFFYDSNLGHITASGNISASGHISASKFVGDGSGLSGVTATLDIDGLGALGGTGLHQTQDNFVFSDNGTEKKITFSNLEDAIFANLSGDATVAAGGAITNAAAQTNINSILASALVLGEDAQTQIDFETANEIHFDVNNVELVNMTGNLVSGSLISTGSFGQVIVSGEQTADSPALYVTGSVGIGNISPTTALNVSGSISASGNIIGTWTGTAIAHDYIGLDAIDGTNIGDDAIDSEHYAAGSIDNAHLADDAVDSDELAAGAVDDAHLSDGVATGLAGTGMTATSGVLNVIGGDGITANANDMAITAAQTTITSILAADVKIGEDDETKVDFETADEIHFYANNANEMIVQANVVAPGADDGTALGDADQRWSDLFLAEGGVINWDNGDVTITQTGNVLDVAGTTQTSFVGNISASGADNSRIFASSFSATGSAGHITASGNIFAIGDISSSGDLVVDGKITASSGVETTFITASGGYYGTLLTATQATIDHDSLANFVGDEHIDHSGVTMTAGTGMTGGGTIEATRTLNVIGGDGITANANDMAITAAQTTIESIYKADLVIGEDAQTQIDFETANEIHFDVNNVELLNMTGNLVSGSLISTGSFGQINILGDTTMADPAASLYVTGSVGIGNLTPTTALNVSGSISASGGFHVSSSGNVMINSDNTGSMTTHLGAFSVNYGNDTQLTGSIGIVGDGYGDIVKIGGTTTIKGSMYYLDTDSTWTLSNATDDSAGADKLLAIALGTNSDIDGMLLKGFVHLNPAGSLVVGAAIYMRAGTGTTTFDTSTNSGNIVRIVGYGLTSGGHVYFNPDSTFVEVA